MQDRPKIVAVVDDEPSMLEATERLLNAHDLVTQVFTSAEEFLIGNASADASCLILDINLGGMSALNCRARLKASGSQLPIIFMTAADDKTTRREAMMAGCVTYLLKPFPAHLLIDAIWKATGKAVHSEALASPLITLRVRPDIAINELTLALLAGTRGPSFLNHAAPPTDECTVTPIHVGPLWVFSRSNA